MVLVVRIGLGLGSIISTFALHVESGVCPQGYDYDSCSEVDRDFS